MSENYDKNIKLKDVLRYTYYDDSHKLVAIIDKEKLKKLFDVDIVAFDEEYVIHHIA